MTFGLWTEVILFSIAFVIILGAIVADMDDKFGQSHDASFGLTTNDTLSALVGTQSTLQTGVNEGQVTNNNLGLSVSTSWNVIKSIGTITWNFITGGWIEKTVAMAQLPTIVGVVLRVLYFISIGFIILKLLFKVNP